MTHMSPMHAFNIRITSEDHERLARLREERHVNVSSWARQLLTEALDREFSVKREHRDSEANTPLPATCAPTIKGELS